MRTDICLVSPSRQVIIDCKFAQSVFTSYRGKESIKASHLYQIYAYLRHAEKQKSWENLEGILLYPIVDKAVEFDLYLDSYRFQIQTIDLNQVWQNIEFDLLQIVS